MGDAGYYSFRSRLKRGRLAIAVMSIGRVKTQFLHLSGADAFRFESGQVLDPLTIAYETYGELNGDASNAILVFHALTGSHHAAGYNPEVEGVTSHWTEECHTGWWDDFIGSGKALDTDHYFVICANYLGSCYGSTGPTSLNPQTGRPYGSSFPRITAEDVVRSQICLLDFLQIHCLHAVIGASLGGMLSILFATKYPQRVIHVLPIATGMETTVLQKIMNFEQIIAIRNDMAFKDGDYSSDNPPREGLSLARMIAHKTFISLRDIETRARSEILPQKEIGQFYPLTHAVESYMQYQGEKFADRFDANSYLRIMDLWQNFKIEDLDQCFQQCAHQHYLIFSIDSDVCFYPEEQKAIVDQLQVNDIDVKYITVHSTRGHDSFLLEPELFAPYIHFTLRGEMIFA